MQARDLRPGDRLGRYRLLVPIAKGGMGQVWAARQSGVRGFHTLVAVKTILASDEDGDLEQMLFEEASLASQVRHPNVVQTLDLGEENGTLYLVMEWVDGESIDAILREARRRGGMPLAVAVHLVIQACRGLHAVHEAKDAQGQSLGIVHRDISPQNLLVTHSGMVKLVDFGVAKATQRSSNPTEFGQVKGKFAYMSPEQVQCLPIDARSDVFAMGAVLYRLTVGKHPFKSESPAATLHNILRTEPVRPSVILPEYPESLERVVMKALARDRRQRFVSAHEMMLALEQTLLATPPADVEKTTECFVRTLFRERITERQRALDAALGAVGVEEFGPSDFRPAQPTYPTMRAVLVSLAAAPARSWRWPIVALAATLPLAGFMFCGHRRPAQADRVAFVPGPTAAASVSNRDRDPPVDTADGASARLAKTAEMNAAANRTPEAHSAAGITLISSKKTPRLGHREAVPSAQIASAIPSAPPPVPPATDETPNQDPLERRK